MAAETILIIDDSPEVVRVLDKHMLSPLGYNIISAPDGQKGLDLFLAAKPDLIMLDMNMPRMDGMEVLLALHKIECQTPVIFMTMHGTESTVTAAFRLGIRDYLSKPFTPDEVKQAVDRALRETRLAREKAELAHNLVASEAVRQTVVTLAHHINNRLMILKGGLSLLREAFPSDLLERDPGLLGIMKDSQESLLKIEAVLRVLQRVTRVEGTNYHGEIKMIDIEAALQEELSRMR
jgi:CheY-like chemotaxis protein